MHINIYVAAYVRTYVRTYVVVVREIQSRDKIRIISIMGDTEKTAHQQQHSRTVPQKPTAMVTPRATGTAAPQRTTRAPAGCTSGDDAPVPVALLFGTMNHPGSSDIGPGGDGSAFGTAAPSHVTDRGVVGSALAWSACRRDGVMPL